MMEGKFSIHRKLLTSDIWEKPAHFLKIWVWILAKANWKDVRKGGKIYRRGEFFTSYEEIIKENGWKVGYRFEYLTKNDVFYVLDFLRKAGCISTTKSTRGLWIKVVKYDEFQWPHEAPAKPLRSKQRSKQEMNSEANNEANNEANSIQIPFKQGKRNKENKIYKYLILSYKQRIKKKTGIDLEVSWDKVIRRISYLLNRKDDPLIVDFLEELLTWYPDSEKAERLGYSLMVALSADTINKFKVAYKGWKQMYAD